MLDWFYMLDLLPSLIRNPSNVSSEFSSMLGFMIIQLGICCKKEGFLGIFGGAFVGCWLRSGFFVFSSPLCVLSFYWVIVFFILHLLVILFGISYCYLILVYFDAIVTLIC